MTQPSTKDSIPTNSVSFMRKYAHYIFFVFILFWLPSLFFTIKFAFAFLSAANTVANLVGFFTLGLCSLVHIIVATEVFKKLFGPLDESK